jgi:hypothetical protein
MLIQGQVGPISVTSSIAAGVQAPIRQGNMGEQIVSELHGRYYEPVYRRSVFTIANQAAVAVTAAMATTWTGLLVGNPTTSTVNLAILGFGYTTTVAVPTATSIGLMTGVGATVTASLTPRNRYVGGASAQALANAGQTLPGTPVLEQVFGNAGTLATTGYGVQPGTWIDLGGSLILPPGAFVASYSFAATTAAWIFSFLWEEVPI